MIQQNRKYLLPLVLIISLFFLWGFAHNLNPILIPHLKKACRLSDTQSALIDSAFFIAYFVMALPAAFFMSKYGYKGGIITGLVLFALGAFLFYPAAETRQFEFFLLALFIIASGLTFLETAANPYVNELGSEDSATQRLNLAQSFNGLAQTLAPLIGGQMILSGHRYTEAQLNAMPPAQLEQYLNSEAASVKLPYLIIGLMVLCVALLIAKTKLPAINEASEQESETGKSIWKESNLLYSVVAQFFYIGAQIGIASFFIRYCFFTNGVAEKDASVLLAIALFSFMAGRFIGTALMKFVAPAKLLAIYATVSVLLIAAAVSLEGKAGIYSLMGTEFFMSIMFPTIFSLGIAGLGSNRKRGSSLLIMSIVGGAILPLIMGRISDATQGNIQMAYIVPGLCFAVVLSYSLYRIRQGNVYTKIILHH